MMHKHDFRWVKRYWVGGGRSGKREYWHLYRCSCGTEKREKEKPRS
jgi:hypothetical protein